MYLERLFLDGGPGAMRVERSFAADSGSIRKWTVESGSAAARGLFPWVALAGCGQPHLEALRRQLTGDFALPETVQRCEFVQVRHAPQERGMRQPARRGGGWIIAPDALTPLPRAHARHLDPALPFSAPPKRQGNKGWLLLGYGRRVRAHEGTGGFEFDDLHHRLQRCASLFEPDALLTDPLAFLERLHYKGMVNRRGRSEFYLARLNRELGPWLGVPPEAWKERRPDFRSAWEALAAWQRTLATLVLDMARHVLDAAVGLPNPFEQSGVVMFDGFPQGVPLPRLPAFLILLDRLFPNLQYLLTLTRDQRARVPQDLLAKTLPIPRPAPRPPTSDPAPRRLRKGTALLVDVDGELPNLALMKLSRFLRGQGKRVVLARRGLEPANPDGVYASCVFSFPGSASRVARLRGRYGNDLQLGGSGVDPRKRLPAAIEDLDPDYSLYPELGDRAIGFLTRGCPRHCSFCIVPVKEGKPRRVGDLEGLLQGRRKLILLDDNLLAHPSAPELLEEMLRRDLQVNFNQTLDLALVTRETAALLRRIRAANVKFTRPVLHFSLNDAHRLDLLRRHYRWLGTDTRDNVEFICMYGFNTTLAEDVARFEFLRGLPGAYVFVQRYRPVPGGPEPDLSRFFDDRADERLDALLRVCFQQNMKSMEVYYRWLCGLYARQRGRIHRPLVDTLFRYNDRHCMGAYLAKLDTLCRDHRAAATAGVSLIPAGAPAPPSGVRGGLHRNTVFP